MLSKDFSREGTCVSSGMQWYCQGSCLRVILEFLQPSLWVANLGPTPEGVRAKRQAYRPQIQEPQHDDFSPQQLQLG